MAAQEEIVHEGVINNINGEIIDVGIQCFSACAACHANQICNLSDKKEKIVKINGVRDNFSIGENVRVVIKRSQGYKAVFLGYVLPFILFFLLLAVCSSFFNELITGVIAISILLPYYYILFLKRNTINKAFTFKLEKL